MYKILNKLIQNIMYAFKKKERRKLSVQFRAEDFKRWPVMGLAWLHSPGT